MAVALAAAAVPRHRRWSDQQPLLKRQHNRLKSLLQELMQRHGAEEPTCDATAALPLKTTCRRLLGDPRLHLRPEERWLRAQGCRCPGPLASQQAGRRSALLEFQRSAGAVQTWFGDHRHGADAMADGLATSRTGASQAISGQRPFSIAPQP